MAAPGSVIAAQALFTANAALGKHFQDTEMARLERRSHNWLRVLS